MAMDPKPLGMEGLLLHSTVYESAAAALLSWHLAEEIFTKRHRTERTKGVPVKQEERQECCGMKVCVSTGK